MKKILLIVHHDASDIGLFGKILIEAGFFISCIGVNDLPLISNKEVNSLNLVIILGGVGSANDYSKVRNYEYKFVELILRKNIPLIGICLGAQIIANLYKSTISTFKNKKDIEVGYFHVNKSKLIPSNSNFLFFHAEGIGKNDEFECISRGRHFDIDSFKIKNKSVYGFQFHPEVSFHMIQTWYQKEKRSSMFKHGIKKIYSDHVINKKRNYNWLHKLTLQVLNA